MNAPEVVADLQARGVRLIGSGEKLRYEAPPGVLTPADLETMRAHKDEILRLLGAPSPSKTVAKGRRSAEWHAEEVAHCVEAEGVCIFWSRLFGEMIAFVKDDCFKRQVPQDVIVYTCAELRELDKSSPLDLVLLSRVHQAKKVSGGTVERNEPE